MKKPLIYIISSCISSLIMLAVMAYTIPHEDQFLHALKKEWGEIRTNLTDRQPGMEFTSSRIMATVEPTWESFAVAMEPTEEPATPLVWLALPDSKNPI